MTVTDLILLWLSVTKVKITCTVSYFIRDMHSSFIFKPMEHLSTFLNILHALTQKLETEEEKKNRKKYRRGWGNFKVQKNA